MDIKLIIWLIYSAGVILSFHRMVKKVEPESYFEIFFIIILSCFSWMAVLVLWTGSNVGKYKK